MLRIPSHALSTLSGPDDGSNGISHALCCLRAHTCCSVFPAPSIGSKVTYSREAPTIYLGSPSRSTLHQLSETRSPAWLPPPTPGIGPSPIPGTKHTSFQQQESNLSVEI